MIIYKADELKEIKTFGLNEEYIKLLSLLEKIAPCNQFYEATEDCLVITYELKLNLFNFISSNYRTSHISISKRILWKYKQNN